MASRGWKRSKEELLTSLQVQLKAIDASCRAYDDGDKWEAIRLANSAYILLHDGGKKVRSILTQLGIRAPIRFVASGHPNHPGNKVRELTLLMIQIGPEGAKHIPRLDQGPTPPRLVQFHTWWENEKIYRDPDGFFLNRRRLVWALRDQEGGAHLDAEVTDPAYIRLSRDRRRAFVAIENGNERPMMEAELATMRQVAWELQRTLTDDAIAKAMAHN
jgi:hypothetical protein